jgi:hypothetical protein
VENLALKKQLNQLIVNMGKCSECSKKNEGQ